MDTWRPTPALARALLLGVGGLAVAVVSGTPELVVLVTPLLVHAALALLARPRAVPPVRVGVAHHRLHEGQGTTSDLTLDGPDAGAVEHVARVAATAAYVATRPRLGAVGGLWGADASVTRMQVSPRRWGGRMLGEEQVALTSRWAGFRVGPMDHPGSQLWVLPTGAPYDSRAEAPDPVGLVGAHRSRRSGSGTEIEGIRPFTTGDRLRRIDWRVSLREQELHVVTTRAEEDAEVLLVVDAVVELGRSEGVDGAASSLDLSVRAAAALAEHHVHRGDRVGLQVLGPALRAVPVGSGPRHLERLLGTLTRVRPAPSELDERPLPLRVGRGTVVQVFSPMVEPAVVNAAALLTRRGLPVVVVDTLPEMSDDGEPSVAVLARRMRLVERAGLLRRLDALGCPVVPWRGPGTLDEVQRRLSRRARLPQVSTR